MATKPRRDKQARIVDAALQLAAENGWAEITLDDALRILELLQRVNALESLGDTAPRPGRLPDR